MKYFLLLCTTFFFFSSPASAQEFKSLFNGEDLSGWNVHGTEKWYVEDGELVCESGPDREYGYLSTEENYKNFVLELDFKQESNGNSGVFIRSSLEGTKISGWQVEVAPPGSHTGGIYESYGRGWLIQPSPEEEKAALKPDDWNHMTIRVEGDEVTSWLNGRQMVHLKDEKIGEATGSIALQIHSATPENEVKVRWKNIRIKVLD
ncbi:protein of unknown function [Fodinibius roseus]|uniref:3-keto-alpha-glucoside-1,2-lyase/3-keto-2-hydroxy-glucal hydratase domain-containing protein n=1 Tax=Fodinibius roseus TaxID=1194090 RepID=A0A1M5LE61_9BACT|nr:DUF1080 domain-containing protein [Fodinibius roseus]SHG62653.1 protein of unknown function [Fodinibius roseus]